MKRWVEYRIDGITPCGTDHYIFLDGRYSLRRCLSEAKKLLDTRMQKDLYTDITICEGHKLSEPIVQHTYIIDDRTTNEKIKANIRNRSNNKTDYSIAK